MEKLVKDVSVCDFRFCNGHYPLRACITNACAQLCVGVPFFFCWTHFY